MAEFANTFVLSEKIIEAFKTDSSEKDDLLKEVLDLNPSQIRTIIHNYVPEGYELDNRIEIRSLSSDGNTGSLNVVYTYRRYIGDGEDDDNSDDLDIDFEIHVDTFEVTLEG